MGSRRAKNEHKHKHEPAIQTPRRLLPIVAALLAGGILVVGLLLLLLPKGAQPDVKQPAASTRGTTTATTATESPPPTRAPKNESATVAPSKVTATVGESAPGTTAKGRFEVLIGKWLRPDGGYVVDITKVNDNGTLAVSYLNPQRINVSKAAASQDGTTTKVFLELRDANYPGCTYDLTYDPNSDQLAGIYYQAALEQRFEVVFVRVE